MFGVVLNLELRGHREDINRMPVLTHMEFMSVLLDFRVNNMERTWRTRDRLKTFKGVKGTR